MNRTLKNGLASAILAGAMLLPTAAIASPNTSLPQLERREARQQRRIYRGIRNGSLNRREARHLERREAKLNRDEARARADGRVTWRERRRLNRELNRDSRRIYRQKHDRQRRY